MNIEDFINGSIGDWYSKRQYVYQNGSRKVVTTRFSIEELVTGTVKITWDSVGDSESNGEMSVSFLPGGWLARDRGYFTEESTQGTWDIFETCLIMSNEYNGMKFVETIALVDENTRIRNTYSSNAKGFAFVGNYIEKRIGHEEKLLNLYSNGGSSMRMPPVPITEVSQSKAFRNLTLKKDIEKAIDKGQIDLVLDVVNQLLIERSLAQQNVVQLVNNY